MSRRWSAFGGIRSGTLWDAGRSANSCGLTFRSIPSGIVDSPGDMGLPHVASPVCLEQERPPPAAPQPIEIERWQRDVRRATRSPVMQIEVSVSAAVTRPYCKTARERKSRASRGAHHGGTKRPWPAPRTRKRTGRARGAELIQCLIRACRRFRVMCGFLALRGQPVVVAAPPQVTWENARWRMHPQKFAGRSVPS